MLDTAEKSREQVDGSEPSKPTEAPKGEGEAKPEKPEGAPESYTFTPHEGAEFDSEVLGAFSAAAKELNLPQKSAQKLLDSVAPVMRQRMSQQIDAQIESWAEATRTDKELGGDNLKPALGEAAKAINKVASPGFVKLLKPVSEGGLGLGNHPEVIRTFRAVSKLIGDDVPPGADESGGSTPIPTDRQGMAKKLYG